MSELVGRGRMEVGRASGVDNGWRADNSLFAGPQIAGNVSIVLAMIRLRHEHSYIPPRDLVWTITEKSFAGFAADLHNTARVDDDNAIDGGIHQRLE